jgi:hypothetical protein
VTETFDAGIPLEEWTVQQLEDVTPVERVHVSKHRAGRQPKMSSGEKRRRKQLLRERMRNAADTAALLKALDG